MAPSRPCKEKHRLASGVYAPDLSSITGGRASGSDGRGGLGPGVPALLAERAVDCDLAQGALEDLQLLIVELRDEQLRDTTRVDRRGLGQAGYARIGQRDHDATGVAVGAGSTDEALLYQPGDSAGHARPR